MRQYALRRLAYLPLIAAFVAILTFFVLRSPWSQDPVTLMVGMGGSVEQEEALREDLGLDDPLVVQFGRWLGDLGHRARPRPTAEPPPPAASAPIDTSSWRRV